MISLDPTEPELITPKTIITFINDVQDSAKETTASPNQARERVRPKFSAIPLHNAERINLASLVQPPRRSTKDPLDSEAYIRAHRRPERQEKQLRNIEKERAQHEKVQLDRLLDELKGPDWLKVMGISGITEGDKKLYEPKRSCFIREVTALIEKFKHWKEEEKRRKLERDQALLEQTHEQETEDIEAQENEDAQEQEEESELEQTQQDESGEEASSEASDDDDQEVVDSQADNSSGDDNGSLQGPPHSSPTNSSDVDAQAARQLLIEASSAELPTFPKLRGNSASQSLTSPIVARPKGSTRKPAAPRPRAKSKRNHSPPDPNRTKASTKPIQSFFHQSRRMEDSTQQLPSPPPQQSPPPQVQPVNIATRTRRGAGTAKSAPTATNSSPPQLIEHIVPSNLKSKDFGLPGEILKTRQSKGVGEDKQQAEKTRRSRRIRGN
ncbi:hypothetical protein UCRPC4_g03477 [Phaeomoniella chlamydospora]|uniref:Something about silencing protein 4 domain-containing protein n=1 Tax=Phaeomoniella chlamydospora TaxID=158046 RepID=A0A0G2GYJ5_PHACM|nr:hypothetical protein UCRPC4_g03477 [Phaeomoniella chlamydospora]